MKGTRRKRKRTQCYSKLKEKWIWYILSKKLVSIIVLSPDEMQKLEVLYNKLCAIVLGCFQSEFCGAGWFISDCCKIWKENKALRKRLCSKKNWSLVWKMPVSPAGIWLQIKSFRNRSKGSLQKECQEMHLDRMSAPTFLKLLEQWATSFQCLIPAHRRRIMKKLKDSHLRHLEVDFF